MTVEEVGTSAEHKKKLAFKLAVDKKYTQTIVLRNANNWRVTAPLRFFTQLFRQVRRTIQLLRPAIRHSGGIKLAMSKAFRLYRKEGLHGIKRAFRTVSATQVLTRIKDPNSPYYQPVSQLIDRTLPPRVLIIAEMSSPQCKKYRVNQKQELFSALEIDCTVVEWTEIAACLEALQTHTLVIFYRVPALENVIAMIDEAKRLRIPTIWEVDDYIFEKEILAVSKTLAELDKNTFKQILEGATLYRKAMLLCDRGIASTEGLAQAMRQAGLHHVDIIENALDSQTLIAAEKIPSDRGRAADEIIRIVYGSGSNTHNIDFQEAAPALLSILEKFPNVHLRIIGALDIPRPFDHYKDQIERAPMCSYEEYMGFLAECHISIAPLECYIFNDSKSNIKYIEASIVKVPSVCSPRAAFTQVITNDENGYLCETDEQWELALTRLITDPVKRIKMGSSAHAMVMHHYAPLNIAHNQVAPLLPRQVTKSNTLRILSVNFNYSPRSFGGATIVAEAVNKLLHAQDDFDVHVLTALPLTMASPYAILRYDADGLNVYGIGLPDNLDKKTKFKNPEICPVFANVLAAVKPDIVHFHSIQDIGVPIAELCVQQGIPYLITLHNSWSLCRRPLMIKNQGKNGSQILKKLKEISKIDSSKFNEINNQRLHSVLRHAAELLTPSQYFSDHYAANGWPKVRLNKNGIQKPRNITRHRQAGDLRFGYVSGNTDIKGFGLIRKVFSTLSAYAVTLLLIDNTTNLGFSSYNEQDVDGIPNVKIGPAYTQNSIDDFFSSIDVLLFPTQSKESSGLTVREALARNVWVIATDTCGATEHITAGQNGYIVPMFDQGAFLKQAILDTLAYFERITVGDNVVLQSKDITYFEDQAAELGNIYRQITSP